MMKSPSSIDNIDFDNTSQELWNDSDSSAEDDMNDVDN